MKWMVNASKCVWEELQSLWRFDQLPERKSLHSPRHIEDQDAIQDNPDRNSRTSHKNALEWNRLSAWPSLFSVGLFIAHCECKPDKQARAEDSERRNPTHYEHKFWSCPLAREVGREVGPDRIYA
jgi:hypothetical protein